MSLYEDVLVRLHDGSTPEQIATDLDRQLDAIRAIIEEMHRRGHLTRIDCSETGCDACPMRDSCSFASAVPAQYVVTEAGRSLLASNAGSF
ncbi:MAG: hypothetical protein ACOCPX_06330 [Halapricum sp.]